MLFTAVNDYYLGTRVRSNCRVVKTPGMSREKLAAIDEISDALLGSRLITSKSVLVPAPQHSGRAEYMLRIANRLSSLTGAQVLDIVRCVPHLPSYTLKKQGKAAVVEFFLDGEVAEGRDIVFIDNVISTGRTFADVNSLFGGVLKPLFYAADYRKCSL